MSRPESVSDSRIGFLTAVHLRQIGHCGGLLVVTTNGRPIEFHCTAPVQPNRAQEILYGKTLPAFLFCDQIGASLIGALQSPPQVIVTDRAEMIGLTECSATPIAWLAPPAEIERPSEDATPDSTPQGAQSGSAPTPGSAPTSGSILAAMPNAPGTQPPTRLTIEWNKQVITVLGERSDSVDVAVALLKAFTELLPLSEPFERIHTAIEEAHKIAA